MIIFSSECTHTFMLVVTWRDRKFSILCSLFFPINIIHMFFPTLCVLCDFRCYAWHWALRAIWFTCTWSSRNCQRKVEKGNWERWHWHLTDTRAYWLSNFKIAAEMRWIQLMAKNSVKSSSPLADAMGLPAFSLDGGGGVANERFYYYSIQIEQ